MSTMLPRSSILRLQPKARIGDANHRQSHRFSTEAMTSLNATPRWPRRPDPSVLSKTIPLFFIGRDSDGFWIACEAEFRIGGIFLCQRSALRFAKKHSEPAGCATVILSELHDLDTENRGNRFAVQLRPVIRLARRLASKLNTLRAYIEDRILCAAMEVFCRDRYKHSNKNEDDLPIVR